MSGTPGQAISFNPTDAESGGSLIDDCEAVIVSVRSQMFDYMGKAPQAVPALHVIYQYQVEGHLAVAHEYYSAGDAKNLAPSVDGRQLIAVGNQGGLNDSTNAFKFMASMVNGGFPKPIGADLAIFDGSRVYVKRVPQPKVQGATKDSKPLLVQKYLGEGQIQAMPTASQPQGLMGGAPLPGSQVPQMGLGATAGMGAAPMAVPTPTAPQGPNPLQDKAVSTMLNVLATKGGAIDKNMVAPAVFTLMANDPDRNALVQLMFTDAFLASGPWKFDGSKISLG